MADLLRKAGAVLKWRILLRKRALCADTADFAEKAGIALTWRILLIKAGAV